MTIKDVLVLLDSNSKAAGPYAVSLASAFEAHLTATAFVVTPTTSMGFVGAPGSLVSALEQQRAAARQILETFATTARSSGITFETNPVETVAPAVGDVLRPLARHYDLALIEQPNPDIPSERESMIEAALFGSGRPVLIVPYTQTAPLRLENVLVAWDGSATAARALGDALPFLARSKRVQLVTVDGAAGETEAPGHRITRHVARHGIDAEFRNLMNISDVAGTLLSHASDFGADLMVMGGYGHSRLRELVFGGATRGILKTMTLPVLMSH